MASIWLIPNFGFVLLVLVLVTPPMAALVVALRTPSSSFVNVGRSKVGWVLSLGLISLIALPIGDALSLYFTIAVAPKLQTIRATSSRQSTDIIV